MSDFNFNKRGIYLLKFDKVSSDETTPEEVTLSPVDESPPHTARNDGKLSTVINSNIVRYSDQKSWNISEYEQKSIADAFHFAGLFFEKLFPEMQSKQVEFFRSEHTVFKLVGDEAYASTYNATKTFKNQYMNGKEFPELNFRLLTEQESDAFTRTLHYALRAMENMAHNKKSVWTNDHTMRLEDVTRPRQATLLTA